MSETTEQRKGQLYCSKCGDEVGFTDQKTAWNMDGFVRCPSCKWAKTEPDLKSITCPICKNQCKGRQGLFEHDRLMHSDEVASRK